MKITKIVITGGSGFIASYLINFFKKKLFINLVVFTRKKVKNYNIDNLKYIAWDAKHIYSSWLEALENTDLLINLTGKNIQCLFTKKNKQELLNSRIDSIQVLSKAIKLLKNPPKLWIQASGLGFYGANQELCCEETKKGIGFLPDLVEHIENTLFSDNFNKTRKISLRFGFALHSDGGILNKLIKLTQYFLGGPIQNGSMYMSYFHLFDLTQILEFLFYNESLEGVFNVCTSFPISNKIFMQELRNYFNQLYFLPIPNFILRIILKYIIGIDNDLIVHSPQAIPKKLLNAGFKFNFLSLNSILLDLYPR